MSSQVLEELKLSYDVAKTGQEALTFIKENHYDLILCDSGLPDMTGFEIARRTRREENPNQTTFIFALTAHHDEEYRKRILASGMMGLLAKPLTRETCLDVLKHLRPSC